MTAPNRVWRTPLERSCSERAASNLLNLDTWPIWNSSAQRVLSSSKGNLQINQRFDIHRVERQRLIEELWEVLDLRKGENPSFLEIEFQWLGQQRNGIPVATALKSLRMTVTVLCEDEGGVEIAAWWEISSWHRFFRGRIDSQAKAFAQQWLNDLTSNGIQTIEDSQPLTMLEKEGEDSKTVGDEGE